MEKPEAGEGEPTRFPTPAFSRRFWVPSYLSAVGVCSLRTLLATLASVTNKPRC